MNIRVPRVERACGEAGGRQPTTFGRAVCRQGANAALAGEPDSVLAVLVGAWGVRVAHAHHNLRGLDEGGRRGGFKRTALKPEIGIRL